MRIFLMICAVIGFSFNGHALDAKNVGGALDKAGNAVGGALGEFVVGVKGVYNDYIDTSEVMVQYLENSDSDDEWKIWWTVETVALVPEKNAVFLKFVVRSDVTDIQDLDFLEEIIIDRAQLTILRMAERAVLGGELNGNWLEYIFSKNDDLLSDFGSTEQANLFSAHWSNDDILNKGGWDFGKDKYNLKWNANANAALGFSQFSDNSGDWDSSINYGASTGLSLQKKDSWKLNWDTYFQNDELAGQDIETYGTEWALDHRKVPGEVVVGFRNQEIEGRPGDRDQGYVNWQLPLGKKKGSRRNRGGKPDPVPGKKK